MQKKSWFSRKVTGSDAFAELSFEAQALYFQLYFAADESGFVSAPKKGQKKKAKAYAFAFWKTGKRNYLCTLPEPSPPASFSTSLTDTRL